MCSAAMQITPTGRDTAMPLMQRPEDANSIRQDVLSPIADGIRARQQRAAGKAAATKVDFFTLVRGDV